MSPCVTRRPWPKLLAAERGGAAVIRCQGLADISAIKGQVEVPVIGLWKEGHDGVYITPTLRHARALASWRAWTSWLLTPPAACARRPDLCSDRGRVEEGMARCHG